MVILNTNQKVYDNLNFRYFLNVPRCDCIFGSARETTGKAHLFLVFKTKDQDKIYKRNGRNQTWVEVHSPAEYGEVRRIIEDSISDDRIPRYTTESIPV